MICGRSIWAIVDLVGKGGHVRTVPVPDWVRSEIDDRLALAAIARGRLFRRVNKVGKACFSIPMLLADCQTAFSIFMLGGAPEAHEVLSKTPRIES
jgi:hypothetical protein